MCEFKGCKMNCNGNGKCIDGICQCNENYSGEYCEITFCERNCSGHGKCNINKGISKCICDNGFTGD